MGVLNEWQKLTRVLPGQPFGDGVDGAYSSATIPTMLYESCSGTSGNKTLTVTANTYSNGDVLLIHQTRGTGVGQWEINRITSGGGTTTLTLQENKQYDYTDSGASQAQCIKIPRYSSINVSSGTWSPTDWGQDVGGIFPIACKGSAIHANTLDLSGGNATSGGGGGVGATGGGFYGGDNTKQGEGTSGAGSALTTANGNGGGGGGPSGGDIPGAGGGHGASGSNGVGTGGTSTGGTTAGSADLATLSLGGGGGGGRNDNPPDGARGGGSGGGGFLFFYKQPDFSSATITTEGGDGGSPNSGNSGGGGGAGGSILVVCQTGVFGTNRLLATAGSGGTANGGSGGAGAVGRIAIHHSGAVTGTTNPTFTDVTDGTLVEQPLSAQVIL